MKRQVPDPGWWVYVFRRSAHVAPSRPLGPCAAGPDPALLEVVGVVHQPGVGLSLQELMLLREPPLDAQKDGANDELVVAVAPHQRLDDAVWERVKALDPTVLEDARVAR